MGKEAAPVVRSRCRRKTSPEAAAVKKTKKTKKDKLKTRPSALKSVKPQDSPKTKADKVLQQKTKKNQGEGKGKERKPKDTVKDAAKPKSILKTGAKELAPSTQANKKKRPAEDAAASTKSSKAKAPPLETPPHRTRGGVASPTSSQEKAVKVVMDVKKAAAGEGLSVTEFLHKDPKKNLDKRLEKARASAAKAVEEDPRATLRGVQS